MLFIILMTAIALWLVGMLVVLISMWHAPAGVQDESGFHPAGPAEPPVDNSTRHPDLAG